MLDNFETAFLCYSQNNKKITKELNVINRLMINLLKIKKNNNNKKKKQTKTKKAFPEEKKNSLLQFGYPYQPLEHVSHKSPE